MKLLIIIVAMLCLAVSASADQIPAPAAGECPSAYTQLANGQLPPALCTANATPWLGAGAIDVRTFGAKCDGTTDDTKAIQKAINAPPTGGTIVFPGVCKITSTLTVASNGITFRGMGRFSYQNATIPPAYLDASSITSGDALDVTGSGFTMMDFGIKYAGGIGAPLAPPAAPTLSQVPGSGCAIANIFAKITYTNAFGETTLSPESNLSVTSGNCLQIASPSASGNATGYKVYLYVSSNGERQQSLTATPIGTAYTMAGPIVVTGIPPYIDSSATAALYTANAPIIIRSKIWSNTSTSPAIGVKAGTSYLQFLNSYVQGFNVGISIYAFGSANSAVASKSIIRDSFFHTNGTGILASYVNTFDVEDNEFFLETAADLNLVNGNGVTFANNYMEQNNATVTNVIISSSTLPAPSGVQTRTRAIQIGPANYVNCGLHSTHPVIQVNAVRAANITGWVLTNCQNTNFITNNSDASSNIRIRGNTSSDLIPASQWLSSSTGVAEYDINQTATSTDPLTPIFSDLTISSLTGTSGVDVRAYGAKCDGTTDDTVAIQNAFNAAQTVAYPHPTVVFPPGKCVVTAASGWLNFTGHDNWQIEGAGHRGTVLLCKASSANVGNCVDMTGVNSSTIRNINFQGGTSRADSPHVVMLIGKTATSPAVSNNMWDVQFQPFYGDYALFSLGSENDTYINPYFECGNISSSGSSCVAGAVFSSCNTAAITSAYATLATPPVSMSEVSLYGHGGNFTLKNSTYGAELDDNCVGSAIAQIEFDQTYFNDSNRDIGNNPTGFGVGFTSTGVGPSTLNINLNDVRMESSITGAILFGGANADCTNCVITGYWAPLDNLSHAIALHAMKQGRISLIPFNAANPIFIGAVSDLGTVVTLMGGETKASFTGSDFIFVNATGTSPVDLQSNLLGLGKLAGVPAAVGAGACSFFSVAGTNAGSCKIQAICGTNNTAVTVIDNVGAGC